MAWLFKVYTGNGLQSSAHMTWAWTSGVQRTWKSPSGSGSAAAGLRSCLAVALATSSERGTAIPPAFSLLKDGCAVGGPVMGAQGTASSVSLGFVANCLVYAGTCNHNDVTGIRTRSPAVALVPYF